MKKEFINVVVRLTNHGYSIDKVVNVAAIKIEDGVYYISNRMKENKNKAYIANYSIVDAKTGLALAFGTDKQKVFTKYKMLIDRYKEYKETSNYKYQVQMFQEYPLI